MHIPFLIKLMKKEGDFIMNNYIVIDVGGSFIKHGLMNEKGEVIKKDKIKTYGNDIIRFIDDIKNIVFYYERV